MYKLIRLMKNSYVLKCKLIGINIKVTLIYQHALQL